MRKTLILTALIALIIFANVSASPLTNSDWASESLNTAKSAGIIPFRQYISDYTKPIRRIELANIIIPAYENITGKKYEAKGERFSDTFEESAAKVRSLGIMVGKGDNTFSPDDYTTREEIAKIIISFSDACAVSPASLNEERSFLFADDVDISDWAKPYVYTANKIGVIKGYENGTFLPKKKVTAEEAVALITRAVSLNLNERPVITSLSDDSVIKSGENVRVYVDGSSNFKLYALEPGSYSYPREVGSGKKDFAEIAPGRLASNKLYYLFAQDIIKNTLSEPVRIYTDSYALFLSSSLSEGNEYATLNWNRLPDIEVYTLKITEKRNSRYEEDIPAREKLTLSLRWEDGYTFKTDPNRTYTVEISGNGYSAKEEIYVPRYRDEKLMEEIYAVYPQSKEEADKLMTTVTVPAWKIKGGTKVSSTVTFSVHYMIADKVKAVFEEIYNGEEKFPIKDIGGYYWRGGRTEHNSGTAIDINSNENYCIYNDGTTIGAYWKPYEDPYSVTPYGDVVNAFEKYGFTWGGDAWSNPRDYMHFSYLGT